MIDEAAEKNVEIGTGGLDKIVERDDEGGGAGELEAKDESGIIVD